MKAEIVCIIDRSGSMGVIADDAIGGFNSFLKDQKKQKGEANLTLCQFNSEIEIIHENVPLADVPPLNDLTYRPFGCTALHDAVCITVDSVGSRLFAMAEESRPDKVIVAILTDGMENASTKFGLDDVKQRLEHQKEVYAWEFFFLAANQDAFAEGMRMGVDHANNLNFAATSKGIQEGYAGMSSFVTESRIR